MGIVATAICIIFLAAVNGEKVPNMRMGSLIRHYHYPYEHHTVLTDDGYYITIGRIPYRVSDKCPRNLGTVVMWHSFAQNGEAYVCGGPEKSLGFHMSDECYDVWLPNLRGTRYSRKHVNYTTSQRKYWNFSCDDLAFYEITAVSDYIMNKTGRPFHAVGTSMGSTLILMTLARLPEYQKIFLSLQLLAPIAFPSIADHGHLWESAPKNLYRELTTNAPELVTMFSSMSPKGFPRKLCQELCKVPSDNCGRFIDLSPTIHTERAAIWLSHAKLFPDVLHMKVVAQFLQAVAEKRLKMFDYGPEKNHRLYGTEIAPTYNLESITIPTYLYHGEKDEVAPPEDVIALEKALPNVINRYLVPEPEFSHLDFILTTFDLRELVNVHIVNAIKNHTKL